MLMSSIVNILHMLYYYIVLHHFISVTKNSVKQIETNFFFRWTSFLIMFCTLLVSSHPDSCRDFTQDTFVSSMCKESKKNSYLNFNFMIYV